MVSCLLYCVFYKFILSLSAGAAVIITSSITLQHKTKEIKLFDNVIEAISMGECNEVKKVFVAQLGQSNMKCLPQTNIPDNIEAHWLDTVSYSALSALHIHYLLLNNRPYLMSVLTVHLSPCQERMNSLFHIHLAVLVHQRV